MLLAGLAVAAGVVVWVVAARSISVLIDRISVARVTGTEVPRLRFDNGTIEVVGARLDTLTTETLPSGLNVVVQPGGRTILTYQGKTFPCGPGQYSPTPNGVPDIGFSPDAGDTVSLLTEMSHLSWPTPLEMNFMTGSGPSWKRHSYRRLTWEKRSGAGLEIVWRVEQGWFKEGGWRPQSMADVTAGLLRVSIKEAADLNAAAVEYLTRTKNWDRSVYRLESRGPAVDGSGEIIAAIHRDDDRPGSPGAGSSVQLLLDYGSRQVTREIAFQ